MPAATYEFDSVTGKLIVTEAKEGFIEEDGELYYYVDGEKQIGLGLIKVGEDYYYIKTSGKVARGSYYAWTTNGYMPAATYEFDSVTGKLIVG